MYLIKIYFILFSLATFLFANCDDYKDKVKEFEQNLLENKSELLKIDIHKPQKKINIIKDGHDISIKINLAKACSNDISSVQRIISITKLINSKKFLNEEEQEVLKYLIESNKAKYNNASSSIFNNSQDSLLFLGAKKESNGQILIKEVRLSKNDRITMEEEAFHDKNEIIEKLGGIKGNKKYIKLLENEIGKINIPNVGNGSSGNGSSENGSSENGSSENGSSENTKNDLEITELSNKCSPNKVFDSPSSRVDVKIDKISRYIYMYNCINPDNTIKDKQYCTKTVWGQGQCIPLYKNTKVKIVGTSEDNVYFFIKKYNNDVLEDKIYKIETSKIWTYGTKIE